MVAVVGVAVLIVAIVALRNPKQDATPAPTNTITRTISGSSAPSSSRSTQSSQSSQSSESSGAPTTRSSSPSTSRTTAVGTQPLVVLNQGLLDGTAAAAAKRFRTAGWSVTSIDEDYVNDVITSTAYYDPDVPGAFLAARALHRQFPTIDRVSERFSNLPEGPVVVVLTSGYQPG